MGNNFSNEIWCEDLGSLVVMENTNRITIRRFGLSVNIKDLHEFGFCKKHNWIHGINDIKFCDENLTPLNKILK